MSMPRVSLPVTASGSVLHTTTTLSQVAYGVWRLAEDSEGTSSSRIAAKVEACLELGITTFDHADIYGGYACEALFGALLKEKPELRDQIEIVTKCDICLVDAARPEHRVKHYNTSAAHLRSSVEQSLQSLKTDRIDLLMLHRPDPLMDADEVAKALAALHHEGKVLAVGVSNFTRSQTDLLRMRMDLPIVANQIELSVLEIGGLNDGTLDHCQQHGIQPMAWSPFAGGRLFTEPDLANLRTALQRVAEKHAVGMDAIALAWLLKHPTRPIPILGTNRIARIQSATAGVDIELDRQDWFAIYEAALGHEVA